MGVGTAEVRTTKPPQLRDMQIENGWYLLRSSLLHAALRLTTLCMQDESGSELDQPYGKYPVSIPHSLALNSLPG